VTSYVGANPCFLRSLRINRSGISARREVLLQMLEKSGEVRIDASWPLQLTAIGLKGLRYSFTAP
jgi:hypothetical protein